MIPNLKSGFSYEKPKLYCYEKIKPGDARYSAVPIMGKPPSPPPPEFTEPPSEPVDKAENGTQDGEKGGELAVLNEVTPESTGLLSLPPLQLNFANYITR